jgi:CBS-domain-containing membrane protein
MNSKLWDLQIDTVVKLCLIILSHSIGKYSMKTDLNPGNLYAPVGDEAVILFLFRLLD